MILKTLFQEYWNLITAEDWELLEDYLDNILFSPSMAVQCLRDCGYTDEQIIFCEIDENDYACIQALVWSKQEGGVSGESKFYKIYEFSYNDVMKLGRFDEENSKWIILAHNILHLFAKEWSEW